MSAPRALHAFVRGRVQGVGFRWAAARRARELGLAGWVRNLRDGRVEVHAEGRVEDLDALASWLSRGPRLARVDDVSLAGAEPRAAGVGRSFQVLPDA